MSLPLPDSDRKLLAEILMAENEPVTPELADGHLDALRRRALERRQRELKQSIVEAERAGDAARLAQLLRDKVDLDRQVRALAAVPSES